MTEQARAPEHYGSGDAQAITAVLHLWLLHIVGMLHTPIGSGTPEASSEDSSIHDDAALTPRKHW
jgi:hypothetical protein